MEETLAMAGVAAAAGIRTIVATPHIRDDYPFDLSTLVERVAEVNGALTAGGIGVEVVPGGEVSVPKSGEMSDDSLRAVALGGGPYLLVESPYTTATDMLENALFSLQVRGFRPVLAHPERSPSFLADIDRLGRIVERGVLCSVTAASMRGRFGKTVRAFTRDMFRAGLVHDVASDAHDPEQRRPELLSGFEALDGDLRGLAEQAAWYTEAAPAAMLAGAELPERPEPPRRGMLRRLLARG
jgi:protein-tyrosine phosphatase